ncbi:MAG: galactose mutarotase [Bacteroidales bacterium]|nr:galactose mutarotase [Bacteroidales bacterium]
MTVRDFGRLGGGGKSRLFLLENGWGCTLTLCDYGARIVALEVPDIHGRRQDVIVGAGTLEEFEKGERSFGITVGRYANRIKGSSFCIDGQVFTLPANENHAGIPVQCHGGREGFDRFVWDAEAVPGGVKFSRVSPDGEGGFPGRMNVSVTYTWSDEGICRISYEAVSDRPTVVNFTNHSYFNLRGKGSILDHLLKVDASLYIQNDSCYCPDAILPVEGSPFDFKDFHRIGYRAGMDDSQLRLMHGPSVCWILDGGDNLHRAAILSDPVSGRSMEVWTSEPCLLMYPGTHLGPSIRGKNGPLEQFCAAAFETMHAADSPNQPRFPSTILRPGEVFSSVTEYRFGIRGGQALR